MFYKKVLNILLFSEKYGAHVSPHPGAFDRDFDKLSIGYKNGFVWDITNPGSSDVVQEDGLARECPPKVRIFL